MAAAAAALFLCVLFSFFSGAGHARERLQGCNGELVILYDPSLQDGAIHFQKSFARLKREVEGLLSMEVRTPVRLVLMEDREAFQTMSGSPFTRAFALPRGNLMVIHVPSTVIPPALLNDVFKHELCHLILHANIPEHRLPRWLDEGVCQWVSGSLGELLAGGGPGEGEILMATHEIFPFESLTHRFPRDRIPMLLAYHQSRKFVEHLGSTHGSESIVELLQGLGEGLSVEEALTRTYGAGLEELEDRWRGQLGKGVSIFIWVSRHLHEILFALMPILVVWAVVVRNRRRRRRMEEEEEDD